MKAKDENIELIFTALLGVKDIMPYIQIRKIFKLMLLPKLDNYLLRKGECCLMYNDSKISKSTSLLDLCNTEKLFLMLYGVQFVQEWR